MEKLTAQQVIRLHAYLIQAGADNALVDELLDHLACDVEYYMWLGLPFESAFAKTRLEVPAEAIRQLHQTYRHELTLTDAQLEQASLDDIVFQFRNKAYGAYDLRQSYRKTLRNAFMMALGLCLMGMALLHMIGRGTWSYWSPWGAVWLGGLSAVTFAGFSWYLQHLRENELPAR